MLDHAILLYRDNFKLIAQILACGYLPLGLTFGIAFDALLPGFNSLWNPREPTFDDLVLMYLLQVPYFLILGFFVMPFTEGALIHGITQAYMGRTPTFRESARGAFRVFWRVLGSNIIILMAVTAGTMMCIVPGVAIGMMWYVVTPVIVLERIPFFNAFGRSIRLMRGNYPRALVLAILVWFVTAGLAGLSNYIPIRFVGMPLGQVLGSFAFAFASMVQLVFYFSTRCRAEHLDLDVLVNAVDAHGADEEVAL